MELDTDPAGHVSAQEQTLTPSHRTQLPVSHETGFVGSHSWAEPSVASFSHVALGPHTPTVGSVASTQQTSLPTQSAGRPHLFRSVPGQPIAAEVQTPGIDFEGAQQSWTPTQSSGTVQGAPEDAVPVLVADPVPVLEVDAELARVVDVECTASLRVPPSPAAEKSVVPQWVASPPVPSPLSNTNVHRRGFIRDYCPSPVPMHGAP